MLPHGSCIPHATLREFNDLGDEKTGSGPSFKVQGGQCALSQKAAVAQVA
jgi:hypothetical protein